MILQKNRPFLLNKYLAVECISHTHKLEYTNPKSLAFSTELWCFCVFSMIVIVKYIHI